MAFIRQVRTASGATAVQIAEYVPGRGQRIIEHVGSAHTPAELGVLLERARGLLAGPGQQMLDLEVEASPPVADLVPPPEEPVLVAEPGVQQSAGRDGPDRVVATGSQLLFDALAGVYADLGFDQVADATFRDLVIARIVEPTSIMDNGRVLTDLGQAPASEKTMRRTLARATAGKYRDRIAAACFEHAVTAGDVSLCLYDVTTLYFEADNEDGLRKVGYSKERRIDPQIVVGLLVDRHGFPLEIGCFEGDTAETTTIVPITEQFAQRHDLADMAVVADAGMLSAKNLTALHEANLRFIVGSRTTKAPIDLASHFRWHGDAFTDGQVIDTITPKNSRTTENGQAKKAEPVWDRRRHPGSWRAVWAYSAKRAVRDTRTLTIQENRAKDVIAGDKKAKTTRFVKNTNGGRTLDRASLERARRLVGLKGYVTNIDAATMPAAEVIASYHDLWHVERSFRMSKTDLRARPMFHHTRDAIEAHLTIVFTALAVSREAQNRTGLAIRNLVRQLRPLRSATIAINDATQTFPPTLSDRHREILLALKGPGVTH
ncbi:IS1634 family transposase [Actinomadura sp. CNU-125]|uniref:IS1634 family transposase n=1 Tax=Actinomadura sp. CNU-125 TaxID=1904961 RepID=UPI00095DB2C3|nr:IS1634 family transposase [Actinomadura sp. CNU-125]OLT30502.1 IS1634 family transposase [Actinomadura sp. CNU-125]